MPQYPFIRHGDPVAAVIDILTNHTPELQPYELVNISGDLTNWKAPQRWIQVSREGGFRAGMKISRPRIDLDVYGEDSNVCNDIMDISLASLFRAQWQYRGWGVRLQKVIEEVGPVEAYDKLQETPRYFCTIRLTTTPDPESMP